MAGGRESESSGLVRHINEILQALVLGVLIWVGSTVHGLDKAQLVADTRILGLGKSLDALEGAVQGLSADRYSATAAERDFDKVDKRLDGVDNRVSVLERGRSRGRPDE